MGRVRPERPASCWVGACPPCAAPLPGEVLRQDGESTLDATVRLVGSLDGSYLPVQGPPGAGKTFTAARAILGLVGQGRKVGITAFTHAAIGTVIKAVIRAAAEAGATVRIGQKYSEDGQFVTDDSVTPYDKASELVDAARLPRHRGRDRLVVLTSDLVGELDTLVVDEAGQLSLANVLAVAPAAANLVLVGDPQQLAQPSKGTHPEGAGASALEHILDGEATIADHRGLFLDQTWRMHPDVCGFISEQVYDERLESRPETSVQAIGEGPIVAGSGLRWLAVDHDGNRTSSAEEARALAEVYEALIGRAWTNEDGDEAADRARGRAGGGAVQRPGRTSWRRTCRGRADRHGRQVPGPGGGGGARARWPRRARRTCRAAWSSSTAATG